MDHIFTFKQLLEKCYELNIDVHQLYVDYLHAYDSIKRKVLYHITHRFCLPEKLVRMTELMMAKTESYPSKRTVH